MSQQPMEEPADLVTNFPCSLLSLYTRNHPFESVERQPAWILVLLVRKPVFIVESVGEAEATDCDSHFVPRFERARQKHIGNRPDVTDVVG